MMAGNIFSQSLFYHIYSSNPLQIDSYNASGLHHFFERNSFLNLNHSFVPIHNGMS